MMSKYPHEDDDNQPNKPFNDAIDHFNKIEGNPMSSGTKMNQLPKGIRWIGYFIFVCILLIALGALIGNFF